jgi:HEAT repeat protein
MSTPLYKGRKLTAILDETIKKNASEGYTQNTWKESQEAVKFLGPKAVASVLKKVRDSNSGVLRSYHEFRQGVAPGIRRLLPAFDVPVLESRTARDLIRPIGDAAVPFLIKGVNDRCMEVRLTCIQALNGVCYQHPEKRKEFLPLFIKAAHDGAAEVRLNGITSIRQLGADAKPAIPTLLWALTSSQAGQKKNSTWFVHAHALIALGSMGQEARDTLPVIKARLNDTNSYTSLQAAVAVWRIDHDFQTVLPVLTNLLPTFDDENKWQILGTLGEMGTDAAPAVPLIEASLQSDKGYIVTAASNALVKIIPPGQPNSHAK